MGLAASRATATTVRSICCSSGDIEGNDIDTAPRRYGSARLGWDFNPDSVAELEWVYMGRYYLEPDNEHKYDGHSLLNLRVSSQFSPQWRGTLRLTNLADKTTLSEPTLALATIGILWASRLGRTLRSRTVFGDRTG